MANITDNCVGNIASPVFADLAAVEGVPVDTESFTAYLGVIARGVLDIDDFSLHFFLIKYLRWSDLVLNASLLIKASGAALVAVWLAMRLPDAGSKNSFGNLNFPTGNFVPRNGTMRFSLSTSGVF